MRRTDRLLQIIQTLRRARGPVTAARLAEDLEISVRTVYRDLVTLAAGRVPVRGEAGIGYVLEAGYDLPPLMFTIDEIEALAVGAQMVARTGDVALARAASEALAKIDQVLPEAIGEGLRRMALYAPSFDGRSPVSVDLSHLRAAIRDERKIRIAYCDAAARRTERVVWPLALAYFTETPVLGAWCEIRQDFRHFRADRIGELTILTEPFDGQRGRLARDLIRRAGSSGLAEQHDAAARRTSP